ncbi:glycosyltransferase family 2 protein [Brachyspira intermedia]|uniref:glycosyltransferase family 2 protein n=1 Tax=Brachyspira intermedia TaxID=84377 RepID=UPI003006B5D2
MNDNLPLVSIIITTYNRAELLKRSINSAVEQTYQNIEIIISDNASTDNTEDVVKYYMEHYKNIIYIKRKLNVGPSKNAYLTYKENTNGKYIYFLHDDDYLFDNNFIEKAVDIFEKYPNVTLVSGNVSIYNMKTKDYYIVCPNDYKLINGIDFLINTSTCTIKGKYKELMGAFHLIRKSELDKNHTFEWFVYGDASIRFYNLLFGDIYFIDSTVGVYTINNDDNASSNLSLLINSIFDIIKFIEIISKEIKNIFKSEYSDINNIITKKIIDNTIVGIYYSSLGKHSKKDLNAFNKSLRRYLTKYKNTTIYNFIHEKVLFIPININLFSIYKDIYYLIIIFFCIRITIKRKDIPINSKFNYSIYASRKLYKNSIINKEDIYYKLTFDKNISSTENIIGKRLKNDIYEFEEITKQDIL